MGMTVYELGCLKICRPLIIKPVLLSENCLSLGVFSSNLKKTKITPVYEKGNKQLVSF